MRKIEVNTSRKYDVVMERGALAKAGAYICEALAKGSLQPEEGFSPDAKGHKICIITDANVDKLYGQEENPLWKSLDACLLYTSPSPRD